MDERVGEVVAEDGRYVLRIGDDVAGEITVRREGDSVVMEHTVVDRERREKGLGGRIVRGALDDVRSKGLTVVPQCPFVRSWVERHEEYADLVRPEG